MDKKYVDIGYRGISVVNLGCNNILHLLVNGHFVSPVEGEGIDKGGGCRVLIY